MKKIFSLYVGLFFLLSFFCVAPVHAEDSLPVEFTEPDYAYEVGKITQLDIEQVGSSETLHLDVLITQGEDAGKTVEMDFIPSNTQDRGKFALGDKVIVYKSIVGADVQYFLADVYRIPNMLWIVVVFVILVIIAARLRGLFAFIGLSMSVVIIIGFIVPRILDGQNPFLISTVGAIVILFVSLFTAHGLKPRTVISAVSMSITIIIAIGVAYGVVALMHLNGVGSEEAYAVQFGLSSTINMKGLLLGGIIIGVLGVLDDVATAQVAAIEELHRANYSLGFAELYRRGFSVGKEHIISLVNTLVLAYAGASLPVFLLFTVSSQPWWVTLNSEPVAEEIVRALVGSGVLVAAVPLTTVLAAFFYSRDWFRKMIIE